MADNTTDWLGRLIGGLGGLGTAAGGAYNLFSGGGKNPADVANQYIGQIPGQTLPYYSPYMEAGKSSMGNLQNQYADLLSGNVQNKLGEGYKESPGYAFKLHQALNAGDNAAARGGYLGTPQHQFYSQQTGEGLANQDYENYLQHQLGLYGLGLQGNQGLNQMGFEANKGYGDTLGNALSQQAAYGFAGQAGKNQAKSQGIGNLFSGLGQAAMSFLPGGNVLSHLFGG